MAALGWKRHDPTIGDVAVVAGVRLSDALTDVNYVLLCERAWFAWATLPLSSVTNLALGPWLLAAWRELGAPRSPAAPAPPA